MKSYAYTGLLAVATLFLLASAPAPKKFDYFAYVPSGDLFHEDGKSYTSISGFFMATTEVTNAQYRTFLEDLKRQGREEELGLARVNERGWNDSNNYSEQMAKVYFSHPAYDNYPVVNVSSEGAQLYCLWLAEKYNAVYPESEVHIRIPTPDEWAYAAKGGHRMAPYPWGGYYVKNAKGCYLLNFNHDEAEEIGADGGVYTLPATAYFPNDYGLYQMSGNVAEMTSDGSAMGGHWFSKSIEEVKTTSKASFLGSSPFVGFRPVMTIGKQTKEVNWSSFNPNKTYKKLLKELETD
ncbi:MAG: SUMF1/EgtB/PvdO family nonheme iron enzyme [Bacteroidota bacterium]